MAELSAEASPELVRLVQQETKAVLGQWIKELYTAFGPYPRPSKLWGSPLKDLDAILGEVMRAPLAELEVDDLGQYAGSAIWTVGNEDDYRHFLPRILELTVEGTPSLGFDPNIIVSKLQRIDWQSWPTNEQKAIEGVLSAAWDYLVCRADHVFRPRDWLTALSGAELDIERTILDWQESRMRVSVKHLSDFVAETAKDFDRGRIVVDPTVTGWLASQELADAAAVEMDFHDGERETIAWTADIVAGRSTSS